MKLCSLPETLPSGTRYTAHGVEFELLEPSIMRADCTYPVPMRRYVASGRVDPAPVESDLFRQSLDLCGAVILPSAVKLDPYVEHRKKIGDDK